MPGLILALLLIIGIAPDGTIVTTPLPPRPPTAHELVQPQFREAPRGQEAPKAKEAPPAKKPLK
jgi:hypothetical protein